MRILHRLRLVLVLLLLAVGHGQAQASFALIANRADALGANGGTSAALTTSGADLIVVVQNYTGAPGTLTDSRTLTWTKLTQRDGVEVGCVIWYAKNANGGAGHTFTITGTGSTSSIEISAWSGSDLTAPFDQENGLATDNAATTIQIGSVTPTTDGQLLVMGLSLYQTSTGSSIDIGTLLDDLASVPVYSGAHAYQIQTTATARNPTWTHTNYRASAAIATFKAATGGGGSTPGAKLVLLGVGD